jgi:hypothetical protein
MRLRQSCRWLGCCTLPRLQCWPNFTEPAIGSLTGARNNMNLNPAISAFAFIAIATLPNSVFAQTSTTQSVPFSVETLPPLTPLTDAQLAALTEAQAKERELQLLEQLNRLRAVIAADSAALLETHTTNTTSTTVLPYSKNEPATVPRVPVPTSTATTPTPVPTAPAPPPAPTINPYSAESGPLTLLNCSGGTIKVQTYNSNDSVLWVAFQELSIANGSKAALKCATSTCKLKVNSGGATGAMSGYRVYKGGVQATNQAAMAKGCSIY